MLSPFDNPAPEDFLLKIEAYARDLAWGVSQGLWGGDLRKIHSNGQFAPSNDEIYALISGHNSTPEGRGSFSLVLSAPDAIERIYPNIDNLYLKFFKKWYVLSSIPNHNELIDWEYLKVQSSSALKVTKRSFELLKQPVISPQIFISYRRDYSSTWALAIEARLRGVGHHNIFIDKDIEAGDEWLEVLKERVAKCDYLVFLVDQNVFESPWMREEYELARDLGKTIIPILHPNVDVSVFDDDFMKLQYIDCRGKKSASSYEDAINRLLSRLGYATY